MRNWLRKGILGAAVVLPALSGAARAQDAGCSLATLKGEYAFGVTAYSPPGLPGVPAVVAGVKFFDGEGNLTQRDYMGGTAPAEFSTLGTETGTYTVDRDCTGSLDIHKMGPPAIEIPALIVISDGGRHIHEVVSRSGASVSADDWKVAPEQNSQ